MAIRESPPYRVRGRLYVVVGFGSGVWGLACAGGGLLRAFAVASVEEDSGGVELVVCGGVVASLCDVVEKVEDVARVVGPRAYFFGESLCWGGFSLLGYLVHGYSGIIIGHICIVCQRAVWNGIRGIGARVLSFSLFRIRDTGNRCQGMYPRRARRVTKVVGEIAKRRG